MKGNKSTVNKTPSKPATVGTTTVKKTVTKHYAEEKPQYPAGGGFSHGSYMPPRPDFKRPAKMKTTLPYVITDPARELCEILAVQRPDGSEEEKEFVDKYLMVELKPYKPSKDQYGNVHVVVDYPKEFKDKRLILFSSHTDTVHRDGGEQKIFIDTNIGHACIRPPQGTYGGQCLGADDGTGVWLMMNMIKKGVPGYYVFHRAEECGGKGSRFIANNYTMIFRKQMENKQKHPFNIAIAFDRKSTHEIITHQQGQRCASDKSGTWLMEQLNKLGNEYELSPNGSFTDTANYKGFIPECFNLGVGYYKQHGPNEVQDLIFAEHLLDALCKIPWEEMPYARDPVDNTPKWQNKVGSGRKGGNTKGKKQHSDGQWNAGVSQEFLNSVIEDDTPTFDEMMDTIASTDDLIDFITLHPLAVLKALKDFDLTEIDLLRYIEEVSASNALTDRLMGRTRGKTKTLL